MVDKLTAAGRAKLVYVSKDAAAGITKGSGTDLEQISIQFGVAYGGGSAIAAFTLPPGASDGTVGWLVNATTVAKYVNRTAPDGPTQAKVAVVKPGRMLKLVGRGLGDVPIDVLEAGAPGAAGVRTAYCVTNDGEEFCHCSQFDGCAWKPIAGGAGAKLFCKAGAADAACEALPPACRDGDGECPHWCGLGNDSDCATCFVDQGLTVLDTCTNLEWEKKNGDNGFPNRTNLNDVNNRYSWAGACTISITLCQPNAAAAATCAAQTGGALGCEECGPGEGTCDVSYGVLSPITTIWDWVNQLNAAGHAGHRDWRLPTVGLPGEASELLPLLDPFAPGCDTGAACIDPVFGPALAGGYWSASTHPTLPYYAYGVHFGTGELGFTGKADPGLVRAVRPGS